MLCKQSLLISVTIIVFACTLNSINAIRLGQKAHVHTQGNIRSTSNKRYPPELMAKLRKINQTQARARQAIADEKAVFETGRKKANEMKDALKAQILQVKKQQKWIVSMEGKVKKLEEKKKALKLKYDLDRIKPILKKAKERQKELSSQQEKWKSSSSAIKDKVAELESKLQNLSLDGDEDRKKNQADEEDEKKKEKKEGEEDDEKNKKNNKGAKKKIDVDLDGLLDELDNAEK